MKSLSKNRYLIIMVVLSCLFFYSSCRADIEFKTKRIEKEFDKLYTKNLDLYQIVIFANYEMKTKFKKNLVITEIYRTEAEQRRYYKKYFVSPHQRWLAVDIRTRNLKNRQIKQLVKSINKRFQSRSRYIPTAFYHDMGMGKHIHIQFKER